MNLTTTIAVGSGVLILLAAIGFAVARFRQRQSPWGLFRSLCGAHRLSARERRLLTHLAWQHQLSQPALLFLDPSLWEAARLGSAWDAQAKNLSVLRERLFQRH